MRTIFRLCLAAAVVAAVGLVAVPIASANAGAKGHASLTNFEKKQNKQIKQAKKKANKAHERIEAIKDWNFFQDDINGSQQDSINSHQSSIDSLTGTVNAIVAGVPDIIGGLQALEAALKNDVAPALTAINDALIDPVTGLVGLNLARPQFGVFSPAGAFLGGTGPVNGADPPFGPEGAATPGTGIGAPSLYVVDFNNDVSLRVYSVNVFPGTAPGASLAANSVNCANAATTCNAVEALSGDTSHVLVKIGTGAQVVDGTAFGGFSVTAFSG